MDLKPQRKKCLICKATFSGRTDKRFCSGKCKSYYHRKLRKINKLATRKVDTILHRNRSILLEIMGKRKVKQKVDRIILDQKKFNYHYFTGRTINKQGKEYLHIYDFRYMMFSDNEVLIVRKKKL